MNGIDLKPSDMCKNQPTYVAVSLVFSALASFPQFLKRETDMVASYHAYPLRKNGPVTSLQLTYF